MAQRQIQRGDGFERDFKKLTKKYRDLEESLNKVLRKIETDAIPPGDLIPGLRAAPVRKERVPCGNRGKRGGARVIYHATDTHAILMYLYVKNDVEDIPVDAIRDALKAAGLLPDEPEPA